MEIQLTWHLLIVIVLSIFIIIVAFKEGDLDFISLLFLILLSFKLILYLIILIVSWGIYGGIVYW